MESATTLSQQNESQRFADAIDMAMFEELGYPTSTWEYAPELTTSSTATNLGRKFWRRKTPTSPSIWMFWQDEPVKYEPENERRQLEKRKREVDAYQQAQVLKKQRLYQEGMTLNEVLPMIDALKSQCMELQERIAALEKRSCEIEFQNEELSHKLDHMSNPYNKK